MAKLHHPGIVRIHEIGLQEGRPYLSLEWCPGGSLAERLQGMDSALPPKTAAGIVARVAQAVHHAHDKGIIHRDLKPDNILLVERPDTPLERCQVKVTDFGLAKRTQAQGATPSGVIAGTLAYISPEQLRDTKAVGPASDVHALGVILYELLTGRVPFAGDNAPQTITRIMEDDPVPPQRLRPDLSADLQTICLKCLEKTPARRYASAGDLASDLTFFIEGRRIEARPPSSLRVVARWVGRRQRTLVAITAACAAVCLLGAWLWARHSDAVMRETRANLHESLVQTLEEFDKLGDVGNGHDPNRRVDFLQELKSKESLYAKMVEGGNPDPGDREALGDIYVRLAWLEALAGDRAEANAYLTKGRAQFAAPSAGQPRGVTPEKVGQHPERPRASAPTRRQAQGVEGVLRGSDPPSRGARQRVPRQMGPRGRTGRRLGRAGGAVEGKTISRGRRPPSPRRAGRRTAG